MSRKITNGPLRNKARTELKLIDALGEILSLKGFTGLNVKTVAEKAQLDRRLIYEYFGGLEGLIKAYLDRKDYWKTPAAQVEQMIAQSKMDNGKEVLHQILERQYTSLLENDEMRKIIHWGLSEDMQPLKELNKERELFGEAFFTQITDHRFKKKNIRAITAILISGIYYLTLYPEMNGPHFCGIDITSKRGQKQIRQSLHKIIEWAYQEPL
ncbi:transcriptional regulator, TetR family [Chitinophaga costaii]|uniref:Transcriptional regulator, TetR family n=1 Tax=Chitinophaga costaii TaxID=1335309 RepID=A0A1C4DJ68_9BACT|nr:TetR family transcriptional regulator [Chitinophaga costaii]PUZ24656.1 TetR/AcrR family transcriptional regulator [Chitinophaga costaii]SCC31318.1 transcriptional regulator, TetR family [Chitinophaga costaii]